MSGALRIASIVEGHGEVHGLPELLRRICQERHGVWADVPRPHRIPRSSMIEHPEMLAKAVRFQARRVQQGGVIILLDSDDDDPEMLRASVQACVAESGAQVPAIAAVAVREYEAWFLAGAASLRGHQSVLDDAHYDNDPEAPRDAKGRLEKLMLEHYDSIRHQVAFNSRLDLDIAEQRSPSFARFLVAVAAIVGSPEQR